MFGKKLIFFLIFTVVFGQLATAQPIPSHYARSNFLMGPAASFQDGLLGFSNPANLQMVKNPESRFYWNTEGTDAVSFNDWGIFSGFHGIGFAALRQNIAGVKVTDYRISTGFGSDAFAAGLGYGWSSGRFDAMGRERLITTGFIARPLRYLSVGVSGHFSLESNAREGVAEIGVRPLGTPLLTLFADAALQKKTQLSDAPWSAGAALQVLPGIDLVGRYFDNDAFTLGLTLNFGRGGVASQIHFDSNQDHAYNTYMLHSGGRQPSIFSSALGKNKRVLKMNLKGRVDYQRYVLFDRGTLRFMDILKNIRAAAKDPRVRAIALNLSGMRVRPEHAWEIRRELRAAQQTGKMVIAFIDNASMTTYHLASVADKIVLDPQGSIQLPGYTLGRTFLKGTLDKLGLGFDEWRFFKYKSAAEALSREKMSDADREQRQDYVDDWYEMVRADVCESRHLEKEKFDELVDNEMFFIPPDALESGLADTLARWSAVNDILKHYTKSKLRPIPPRDLPDVAIPYQNWGEQPKIAIVYGLGVCAMDEGIRARWLERVFLKLAKKKSVKAVVFRVDSPGGDGMASDLVAEAIKKCKKEKPVIISQGQVAGSGGYWISMYGDQIVAGPNTITGSIGVIGGWIYNKGFTEKLGMTSDLVQRGAHADVGFGVTLPFIGARIPARNLTTEERQKVEIMIKKFYAVFVEKVAAGRGLSVERVKEIAQGHFYSGLDGQQIGLVDKIGGLFTAIAVAQQQAGIPADARVKLVEIPKSKGLFNLKQKLSPIGSRMKSDPVIEYIRMVTENPGAPLPMMLPGSYPDFE
ncbi:hypothetical protein B1H10_02315 [candidate division KSB1 bacterium 4484_188]|nr:MAG: hypothetical protein B1H10_02315 [candidate division KSB1 bacterium 4484_188]